MHALGWIDAIGFTAGALTLITFAQTSMRAMRMTAIAANLCFISYGVAGGFVPIFVLHALLLPINVVRLQALLTETPFRSWRSATKLAQTTSDPGASLFPSYQDSRTRRPS